MYVTDIFISEAEFHFIHPVVPDHVPGDANRTDILLDETTEFRLHWLTAPKSTSF